MRCVARKLFIAATCLPAVCLGQLPAAIQPPASQHIILSVTARGAQVYGCRTVAGGFQWVFHAPVARLFDADGKEVGTHGDGPIWTSDDSSSVSGKLMATVPARDLGDIAWLLLKAADAKRTGVMSNVEFITRSETHGGVPPSTGCDAEHQGELVHVPYTAAYTFYSSQAAAH